MFLKLDICCDDASFFKKFVKKYLCWFAYREPYVLYETMLERFVSSTSSSNIKQEVVDDNSNCYRSMVMDEMWINHGYSCKYSRVDEEPNIDTTRFFDLVKDFD
jgi:hypothetical protein